MKAYIVRSIENKWNKPYLFCSEAAEIAELMTVASGKHHWIVETQMSDLLNALVQFEGKELILDIWNVIAVGEGFQADVLIEGNLYKVQHLHPFKPWDIVQNQTGACRLPEVLEQSSAMSESQELELAHSTTEVHNKVGDDTAYYDQASTPKRTI